MRIIGFVVLGAMLCLSGCAYRAVNGVRIQGKDVDAKYSQLTQSFSFKGKEVQATIIRQSTCANNKTAQKVPAVYDMPNIKEGQLTFDLIQK